MSDGNKLHGQQFDPRGPGLVLPFTEQVKDYGGAVDARVTGDEGDEFTEIHPIDKGAAKVVEWDSAAIADEMENFVIKVAGKTIVDLPDVLTGLSVTYNSSSGNGLGSHPKENQALVVTGAGAASARIVSSAQASAAMSVELIPTITRYGGKKVPCTHCFFYSPLPVTLATILSRLTTIMGETVTDLPVFKEKIYTFVLKGGQVSLKQSADSDIGFSFNTDVSHWSKSVQWGSDKSVEVGITSRPMIIGPVINDSLSISNSSDNLSASTTVSANTNAVTGSLSIDAITNEPSDLQGSAEASVEPSSISATTPAAVPTSGLHLVDLDPSIGEYGHALIHAIVVDFVNYA